MDLHTQLAGLLAYLDPGTGSTLIQVLIGATLGILVAVKGYWHRIAHLFNRNKDSKSKEDKSTKNDKD